MPVSFFFGVYRKAFKSNYRASGEVSIGSVLVDTHGSEKRQKTLFIDTSGEYILNL